MLKFNHTAHKKLWNWLAENPEMAKEDWPEWEWNGGEYESHFSDCFACECCEQVCSVCPLKWPKILGKKRPCYFEGGLFATWANTEEKYEKVSLAHQIANLPVKEGVETE